MKRIPWSQWVSFFVGSCLLLFSYTNCGKSYKAVPIGAASLASLTASPTPLVSPTPTVSASPTPTPTTAIVDPSKSGGTTDANCLNNNSYDACIVWKNPVASQNMAYSAILMKGQDLTNVQTFGVTLKNRLALDKLKSTTINVTSSTGGLVPLSTSGQYRGAYSSEGTNAYLAQLMAYFWITYQETEMVRRGGAFYAAGRNIPVDAYGTDPNNASFSGNAYYSPSSNSVGLGYAKNSSGAIAHEMALSAEVYLHEMGHANLKWALNGTGVSPSQDPNAQYLVKAADGKNYFRKLTEILSTDSVIARYCLTQDGCIYALNEGQADFHHLMIFQATPPMGETIFNTLAGGLNSNQVPRDVRQTKSWTTSQYFTSSASVFNSGTITVPGEIHGMGTAYASMLWETYTHPQMNKTHFEKIFVEHLKLLTANSRFKEARDALIATAAAMAPSFGGVNYGPIIRGVFDQKGVAP